MQLYKKWIISIKNCDDSDSCGDELRGGPCLVFLYFNNNVKKCDSCGDELRGGPCLVFLYFNNNVKKCDSLDKVWVVMLLWK
jgi:hypothetical protein